LTGATGINDAGWVSANGFNYITGESHAFMLVPDVVPEPATYAILLLGLGVVGAVVRKRRPASAQSS
jgi:hypothetical protein